MGQSDRHSSDQSSILETIENYFSIGDIIEAQKWIDKLISSPIYNDLEEDEIFQIQIYTIEILIRQGQSKQAHTHIKDVRNQIPNMIQENNIELTLLEANIHFLIGKTDECQLNVEDAFIHLNQLLENPSKEKLKIEKLNMFKAKIYRLQGLIAQYKRLSDESLQLFRKAFGSFTDIEYPLLTASLNDDLARHYRRKFKYEKALEYVNKGLELRKKTGNLFFISNSYHNIGMINQSEGKWDLALENHDKAMSIRKQLKLKRALAESYTNMGSIYNDKGELNHALKYNFLAKEIYEELDYKNRLSIALNNIGDIYRLQGNLDTALDYLEQSLAIERELDNKDGMAFELLAISKIHILKGDLEKSREYLQLNLALYLEFGNDEEKAQSYLHLGKLNLLEGDSKHALKNFKDAYRLGKSTNNVLVISDPLFQIIHLLSLHSDKFTFEELERLEDYFIEMEQLHKASSNKIVQHRYLLADASMHLDSDQIEKTKKIHNSLDIIIDDEIADINTSISAILLKCELFLNDLKDINKRSSTGKELIQQDLKNCLNKGLEIAEKTKSYPILIRVYLLNAKISLLYLEFDKAKGYLMTARNLSLEKGYELLTEAINKEIDRYTDYYYNAELNPAGLTFDERFEHLELNQYITSILDERLEYLLYSEQRHRYTKVDNLEISLCGEKKIISDQMRKSKSMKKCVKCRKLSFNQTLEKIVIAHLLNWKCIACYNGLAPNSINELLKSHIEEKNSTTPYYNEFIGISSYYLDGKMSWYCPEFKCENQEKNILDLKEINEIFS